MVIIQFLLYLLDYKKLSVLILSMKDMIDVANLQNVIINMSSIHYFF